MDESSANEMITGLHDVGAMLTALGDPSRRQVFEMLRSCCCAVAVDPDTGDVRPVCGVTVGEVCCAVPIAQATVSQHLKVLREAGLIVTERDGKFIRCGVDPRALRALSSYFDLPAHACEDGCC